MAQSPGQRSPPAQFHATPSPVLQLLSARILTLAIRPSAADSSLTTTQPPAPLKPFRDEPTVMPESPYRPSLPALPVAPLLFKQRIPAMPGPSSLPTPPQPREPLLDSGPPPLAAAEARPSLPLPRQPTPPIPRTACERKQTVSTASDSSLTPAPSLVPPVASLPKLKAQAASPESSPISLAELSLPDTTTPIASSVLTALETSGSMAPCTPAAAPTSQRWSPSPDHALFIHPATFSSSPRIPIELSAFHPSPTPPRWPASTPPSQVCSAHSILRTSLNLNPRFPSQSSVSSPVKSRPKTALSIAVISS